MSLAHLQGSRNDGTVAEMDAVEIAHRDHGPPWDGGRMGSVADNGKTSRHFRDSSEIVLGFLGSIDAAGP
jgi:hypothetical protein